MKFLRSWEAQKKNDKRIEIIQIASTTLADQQLHSAAVAGCK